ncbi:39S ribosomal protein L13 [Loa loa]|uniref:39S ribosomal protein L13 n=1 Tax=Loa loa TaxID=7209 RepID=A0A1S0TMI4_LOALO|nr:39S ribosomal protein L13 [Loa loa]EFO16741.1 39S ribosomal protein L13 [Loa loa]
MGIGRMRRVQQWLLFARQWHLIDATGQDVWILGKKVANYLAGKHKPIYHPFTDCGDHVVVINCKDVAMHGFSWKNQRFFFDKEMPKSKVEYPAWQIQDFDPCRLMHMTVYRGLDHNQLRKRLIERLHLFADDQMPMFVRRNIGNHMEQVQRVPKRSDEYTAEERAKFPRLFKFGDDHFVDWERPVEDPGQWVGKDRSPFNPYYQNDS